MPLSDSKTVVALVNGMVGGSSLVLPILALKTGYILTAPVTIISTIISCFSCLLCLRHLKDYKDLDEAVLKHFKDIRYKIAYDLIIAVSMLGLLILYFSLICEQWEGITMSTSKMIPTCNFAALLIIIFVMNRYHFGTSLLAYGILSIIGYVIFLMWMAITTTKSDHPYQQIVQQQHQTLPFSNLVAALSGGLAIQTFFIPVLRENPNRKKYIKLVLLTYILGGIIYSYIQYVGAYSVGNRIPIKSNPDTIEDFFATQQWEVIVIEVIYLIHLYSTFPQFLLVGKYLFTYVFPRKRFFCAIDAIKSPHSQELEHQQPEDSQNTHSIKKRDIIYVLVYLSICFAIEILEVSVTLIVQLNGAIISFFFIYMIPIGLHVKCLYFSKKINDDAQKLNEEKVQKEGEQAKQKNTYQYNQMKQIEMGDIISEEQKEKEEINEEKVCESDDKQQRVKQNGVEQRMKVEQNGVEQQVGQNVNENVLLKLGNNSNENECGLCYKYKFLQYGEAILMLLMLVVGIFTMVHTLSELF